MITYYQSRKTLLNILKKYSRIVGISISCILLIACTQSDIKISQVVPAITPTTYINVFVQKPLDGWHITVADLESQQELSDTSVTVPKATNPKVPKSEVTAKLSSKTTNSDAITMHWKEAWRAAITFEGGTPIDAQKYIEHGILSFDINVSDLTKGGLAFKINCGRECERSVPYLLPGRALQGKGWQHLSYSLKCFAREGDDFSGLTQPFGLESSGTGELSIANIKYELTGTPNASCPDYKTVSVTPSMLNEAWSIDWWLPRHEQKLEYIKEHKVDLVFIGDSITHGWETGGFNIWNKYYGNRHSLDLGFSGDRTENVLWRLQHGEVAGINPKVVVLLIGTNNTGHRYENPETTAIGIKCNIDELQQRLPNTKILLLAIFPRDEKPDGVMRQINNKVNVIISAYADNKKIFFLDINSKFLGENGVLSKDIMPDFLHPNEKGYEILAKAMEPMLVKLWKN